MLSNTFKRAFSTANTKIAIIGAGPSGHTLSAQLMRTGYFKNGDITVYDPSETQYYQPSFTMVGGGCLGDAAQTKQKEGQVIARP